MAAESCPNLRKFELPKVNCVAEILIELLDATSVWYIPPILKGVSLQAVECVVQTGEADSLIIKLPCHWQAVQRHVQPVIVAFQKVCGVSHQKHHLIKKTKCQI